MTVAAAATTAVRLAKDDISRKSKSVRRWSKTQHAAGDKDVDLFRWARHRPRFLIDPRYSKFSQVWDVCTMLALIFTALVTPFEVSFLSSPSSWDDIDSLFVVRPPPAAGAPA